MNENYRHDIPLTEYDFKLIIIIASISYLIIYVTLVVKIYQDYKLKIIN